MKCDECNNANICLDHIRFPGLCGCTSGIPDHKVTTNADRIRHMSDEELADTLFNSCLEVMHIDECPYVDNVGMCKKCILEWLQSKQNRREYGR